MQIEDITWISLTSWWTTKNQRHLTICDCLLRQVVVDHQCVTACVAEQLSDSSAGVWRVELHGSRVSSSCRNNDCVIHCSVVLECLHQIGYSRSLLTYSDVDTVNWVAVLEVLALVYDCVNCDCCLTCLTVADDKLTLTSTDWYLRVDSLKTGLERLVHWLTEHDSRSLSFQRHLIQLTLYRSLAVDRITQSVNDTAQQAVSSHHRSDTASSFHGETFLYVF